MIEKKEYASQTVDNSVCLIVKNLKVSSQDKEIIHGLDFVIHKGERFGLIGESGSGKSLTCLSIMGLLNSGLRAEGQVELVSQGVNLLSLSDRDFCRLRGDSISMVFQEPMTALNPLMTVGKQIFESLRLHNHSFEKNSDIRSAVITMLETVGISDASRVYDSYPFQLSGGQRQRVMLSMAMINKPDILLADEPTTALDVTVQKQVIKLMDAQVESARSSLLFITHDLGVVSELCDTIAIMRRGSIVERGPLKDIFAHPQHPYTKALLAAAQLKKDPYTNRLITLSNMRQGSLLSEGTKNKQEQHSSSSFVQANIVEPSGNRGKAIDAEAAYALLKRIKPPHDYLKNVDDSIIFNRYQQSSKDQLPESILQVTDLKREFKSRLFAARTIKAVDSVSFDVHKGEKFGIVGESGCGKSTTLRILAGLDKATSGSVLIKGHEIEGMSTKSNRWVHETVQIIFQDPMSSLDPRMRIWESVSEPILNENKETRRRRAAEMIHAVGMDDSALDRFPHQFSGGQRQRIAIARSLVTYPEILIADEAVSALDVSVRAQVLNLLSDLADAYAFTLIFVSHDLHVVRNQCDVIAVMNHGHIVECGSSDDIYNHPLHEYTRQLISAMPQIEVGNS